MLVTVFVRRLREGATFADFIAAWEADQGFGVGARVFNAVSLDNDRDILSVGFVDIDPTALNDLVARVSGQEAARHSRIEEVIERTELRAFYELRSEHDFSSDPRQIPIDSAASLLAALTGPPGDA